EMNRGGHADAKEDAQQIKKMVKPGCMKKRATGGKVKQETKNRAYEMGRTSYHENSGMGRNPFGDGMKQPRGPKRAELAEEWEQGHESQVPARYKERATGGEVDGKVDTGKEMIGQVDGHNEPAMPRYNAAAVDRAIDSSNRSGRKISKR